MNIRVCQRQHKGKTYRYAQLVENYRRESDGRPTCRVIAHLGPLPDQTVANLRLALKASRDGQVVVLPATEAGGRVRRGPEANLSYLDLAVLRELWRQFGGESFLAGLLAGGDVAAADVSVLEGLILHRCVAPGSKLHAQRWYPTTALPELTGLAPRSFSNTRVHRVLDTLHEITPALMKRLPELYGQLGNGTAALYMDVTRTHFEGRGCDMAEWISWQEDKGKRLSIGIVLLVEERGYPLRWRVISGATADPPAMGEVVREVAGLEWLGDHPIVFDRAMGQPLTVGRLLTTGVRFITAAHANSIETYTDALPFRAIAGLDLGLTEKSRSADIQRAAQAAREAGMTEVGEEFVLDLGVVDVEDMMSKAAAVDAAKTPALHHQKVRKGRRAGLAAQLELARSIRQGIDDGRFTTQSVAARQLGLTRARVTQLMNLLRLSDDLQKRILEIPGGLELSERRLRQVLKERDLERQRALFEQAVQRAQGKGSEEIDEEPIEAAQPVPISVAGRRRLRLVASFIPRLVVDQRRHAKQRLRELEAFIAELNAELYMAGAKRDNEVVRRRIYARLARESLVDCFDVRIDSIEVPGAGGPMQSWRCTLKLKPDVWERRQRYNGFLLLIGHPDIEGDGPAIVASYRRRDLVEKDFQTIKSEIKLRPIYHYTDSKVVAHVTLCMLALLLERRLETRLREAGMPMSAKACLEILQTCHLNRHRGPEGQCAYYTLTAANEEQRRMVKALGLEHLVAEEAVQRAATPRLITT